MQARTRFRLSPVAAASTHRTQRQREWLQRWRAWGRPDLSPEIIVGCRNDGCLMARFGSSEITATLVDQLDDCAGEYISEVEVAAYGETLWLYLASLSPIRAGFHEGHLTFRAGRRQHFCDLMMKLCNAVNRIHFDAANQHADVEAMKALGFLPDLGQIVATLEGRILTKAASRTPSGFSLRSKPSHL